MTVCPACGKKLPSSEFAFCPWCSAVVNDQSSVQRKTVTILFCDLVDSTALGARTDPEVLRGVLEAYWSSARAVLESHGGTVEKFIGDAVVGVFGMPVLHEDDALRAVRAAADLLTAVRRLNEDLGPRLDVELAVRIGVNTGEVLAGTGGETLMSGDAANVAARLQSSASVGQVLIGRTTHTLVRDSVLADEVGPLLVKGKVEPLVAFQLLGVGPESDGQVRKRRLCGRFVGRDRQLRLAESMYATAVEERSCAILTVVGEPGVGKSRLVDELLARIGDEALVLTGRCLPYGEGITYAPVAEMLRRLGQQEPRSFDDLLRGVPHSDQALAGLEALRGQARASTAPEMAWAFRRLVETLARERPVVVVVDDLHWAQPGLLDLLDHLTELARNASILVLVMARPELHTSRPTWGAGRPNALTIALAALSSGDSRLLADDVLGHGVDDALRQQIAVAAEGIPLFIEETMAMLVDEGQLVQRGSDEWVATGAPADIRVPATVQALLAARLDQLSPDLRAVIDAASVVGKTFSLDVLNHLLATPPDLGHRIDGLVRADLVRPNENGSVGEAYTFTHLLTAETAYQALPKRRRAVLHEQTARWLQSKVLDDDVVAFHLDKAANYLAELGEGSAALTAEAVRLLLTVVDRSTAFGDAAAAVSHAERACRLTPVPATLSVQARIAHSRASRVAGDTAQAIEWARQAEQHAELIDDRALLWRARIQRNYLEGMSDPAYQVSRTFELCEQAIRELGDLRDEAGLADVFRLRAFANNYLGQINAGSRDALSAIEHAHRAPAEVRRYSDLLTAVLLPTEAGNATIGEGRLLLDRVQAWVGDDPGMSQDIEDARLWFAALAGDPARGRERLREKYDLLLEQGSIPWAASWLASGIAWCERWDGDLEAATQSLRTAGLSKEQTGETAYGSQIFAELALFLALLGRSDEAATALVRSRELGPELDPYNAVIWAGTEGLLAAIRGDGEASDEAFREALRVVAETEFSFAEAELRLAQSQAREHLGDLVGAREASQQALRLVEHKGFEGPIAVARTRIVELGE